MDIEELIHVFEAHTVNVLFRIEGDEDEYNREELLEIIEHTRVECTTFLDSWLIPILDELAELRKLKQST